jgi:hypothetical protein
LKTPILVSMEWEKLICSYGLQRYGCDHLRNWDSIWIGKGSCIQQIEVKYFKKSSLGWKLWSQIQRKFNEISPINKGHQGAVVISFFLEIWHVST